MEKHYIIEYVKRDEDGKPVNAGTFGIPADSYGDIWERAGYMAETLMEAGNLPREAELHSLDGAEDNSGLDLFGLRFEMPPAPGMKGGELIDFDCLTVETVG